jgi:hypothetical protein
MAQLPFVHFTFEHFTLNANRTGMLPEFRHRAWAIMGEQFVF